MCGVPCPARIGFTRNPPSFASDCFEKATECGTSSSNRGIEIVFLSEAKSSTCSRRGPRCRSFGSAQTVSSRCCED